VTQPVFEKFKPVKPHVPPSRPKSVEGLPFEFELEKNGVGVRISYKRI
jgi:hypothetical protein